MDLAVDLVACRCADFLNGECVRLKCAVLTKTPGFGNQKFSITVTAGAKCTDFGTTKGFILYKKHCAWQRASRIIPLKYIYLQRHWNVHHLDFCQVSGSRVVRNLNFLNGRGFIVIRRRTLHQVIPSIGDIFDYMGLIIPNLVFADKLFLKIALRVNAVGAGDPLIRL